jgi:hypothetical protein
MTVTDLVFDSFILSDFQLLGKDLNHTLELNGIINGLGLFSAIFMYALLNQELNGGFLKVMIDKKTDLYNRQISVYIVNAVAILCHLFLPIVAHNVSYFLD